MFFNAISVKKEGETTKEAIVMMGIGFPELMIILVIIMIIFGAGKLPEIGTAFGNTVKNFKKSMKESESSESETNVEQTLKEVDEGKPSQESFSKENEVESQRSPSQIVSES